MRMTSAQQEQKTGAHVSSQEKTCKDMKDIKDISRLFTFFYFLQRHEQHLHGRSPPQDSHLFFVSRRPTSLVRRPLALPAPMEDLDFPVARSVSPFPGNHDSK